MDGITRGGCPGCRERDERIRSLEARLAACEARVAQLEAELAKAKKNSSNSSKPPSSDIVNPPKSKSGKRKKGGKRGGQPGHPRNTRPAFTPEEIDKSFDYYYDHCPDCSGPVVQSKEPIRILQQVELVERPIIITEHRSVPYYCPHCQTIHYAPIDKEVVAGGLVGPRLTTLIAFLKGGCHCSYSTIHTFVKSALGVSISRGQLVNVVQKVATSLDGAYQQLLDLLPSQTILNVDETGHKNNGDAMWTWCFRASLFTLFKISPSRGSGVLLDVLGEEFNGVLGCDYFSAYRKYMKDCNVLVQFCLAHLIRDIKFLTTHPDRRNRAYGRRVLDAMRNLFSIIHRRETMTESQFALAMEDAGALLWGEATHRVPWTREAQNMAERFDKHGESYIRFITTPGIEPTNNLAEQAIRFVVLDRKVTQGSRSEAGQRWLERIWTVIATCAQQRLSAFKFLYESIVAHFNGVVGPSLVPDTS